MGAKELAAEISHTRNSSDSAAYRMVKAGVLTHPERGVFALSPGTLRKIQHREPIHVGHNVFIPDLALPRVALRLVR